MFRLVITGEEKTIRSLRGADTLIALEMYDVARDIAERAEQEAQDLNPSTRTRVRAEVKRERRFSGRDVNNNFEVELQARGPKHLEYIVRGTRPHTIKPNPRRTTTTGRRPALNWENAQHPMFEVHHPGTSPNPFLEVAKRKVEPYSRLRWRQAENNLGRRFS
jgi:hypothetical protein